MKFLESFFDIREKPIFIINSLSLLQKILKIGFDFFMITVNNIDNEDVENSDCKINRFVRVFENTCSIKKLEDL